MNQPDRALAIDSLPVGVAAFAADSALTFANPRFLAMLGMPEADRAAPLQLDRVLSHMQWPDHATLAGPENGSLLWQRADGATIQVVSTALPDGGRTLTLSDVSTLAASERSVRQAKAAAEAANQAKSRFLATMGRELRSPLHAAIGFSEAMLREADHPSPARVAEFARQINEASRNLLDVINVILDVASIESGQVNLAAEPVDVVRLLRNAIRQADAAAQAAEITLAADLPKSLPALRGDERRLMQVLAHLLSNAIKFTGAGGSVKLGARREAGGGLLIFVQDSGTGIAPDRLESVFEPFNHGDAEPTRRFQGAGLGLYMSRALVQAHGGQLTLNSQLGTGTTAEIRLPT